MTFPTYRGHRSTYACTRPLTADDVQGAQGDVAEAVELALPRLLLQLLHQDLCLLVHHLQEVRQDGEVEGGSQHLPPLTPLLARADQKDESKIVKGDS